MDLSAHTKIDQNTLLNDEQCMSRNNTEVRSSHSHLFFKIDVLKNFTNFTGKHLCWSLFLLKKTPTHVFCCETSIIFKNNFFYRIPPVAASVRSRLTKKNIFVLISGTSKVSYERFQCQRKTFLCVTKKQEQYNFH